MHPIGADDDGLLLHADTPGTPESAPPIRLVPYGTNEFVCVEPAAVAGPGTLPSL